MVYPTIASAGLAATLGLFASAAMADGEKGPAKVLNEINDRVEYLDRTVDLSPRARVHRRHHYRSAAAHHRHSYRHASYGHHRAAYRGWDGRYGRSPRQHFFVTGVSGHAYPGLVNVATVTYRSYVYYTPTYPSVSYGYPPHAYLYDLTAGPVYNRPCFC